MPTVHTAEARLIAKDMATPTINAVKNSISGLNTATDVANRGFASGLSAAFGKASLAGAAFGLVASNLVGRLKELSARAEEVTGLSTAFGTLTARVGASSKEMLGSLRPAVRGLVSDMDLMRLTNQAILLGIPVTTEKMGEMAETAYKLSRAMGIDAKMGLESLIVGIGRQSKLWLDNLGILVDVDAAYEEYARTLGKTKEELTEAEKKIAFLNETMRKAKEATDGLAESTPTVGMYFGAIEVAARNATNMVLGLANVLGGLRISREAGFASLIPGGRSALNMLGIGGLVPQDGVWVPGIGVIRYGDEGAAPEKRSRLALPKSVSGGSAKKSGGGAAAAQDLAYLDIRAAYMNGAYSSSGMSYVNPLTEEFLGLEMTSKEIAKTWDDMPDHFQESARWAQDLGLQLRGGVVDAALNFGDALVDAIATGSTNWRQFFAQMLSDFAKLILRAQILKSTMTWMNTGVGSRTAVNAAVAGIGSIGAFGFAMGGVVPGMDYGYDSVPAMLRPGELVLTRSQAASMSRGSGVSVVYNIDARGAGPGVSAEIRRALDAAQDQVVARAVAQVSEQYGRGGNFRRSLS